MQPDRVKTLFDALSATYDAVGVAFFQPIADGLVAAVEPQPGECWLDAGCGRGAVLHRLAACVGANGRVTGFDISRGMLAGARTVAPSAGLLVADAQSPPLAPSSFDGLTSSLVLFFLPDPLAALRAWRPLLRPGGRIGVATFGANDPRWDHVDDVFEPYLPPAMKIARGSGGPFASDEGVEALLVAAGFSGVRTITHALPVRFADTDRWYAFTMSTGQRALWHAVPEAERPHVRAEAERRLHEHASADGAIVFEQEIRYTLGVSATPGTY